MILETLKLLIIFLCKKFKSYGNGITTTLSVEYFFNISVNPVLVDEVNNIFFSSLSKELTIPDKALTSPRLTPCIQMCSS